MIFAKQYVEPKRLRMFAVVEKERNTLAEHRGSFYTNLCRAAVAVELQSGARAGRTDSPSNRIQITFPPSPSAEALCGHGTPPCGVTIISYGSLKAARSRTEKSGRVIAAVQTIVRCEQRPSAINEARKQPVQNRQRSDSDASAPLTSCLCTSGARDAPEKDRRIVSGEETQSASIKSRIRRLREAPRCGKKWKRTYRDRSFASACAQHARSRPRGFPPPSFLLLEIPSLINRGDRRYAIPPLPPRRFSTMTRIVRAEGCVRPANRNATAIGVRGSIAADATPEG